MKIKWYRDCFIVMKMIPILVKSRRLGLGLQGLYSTKNGVDNILGHFTTILQIKLQE